MLTNRTTRRPTILLLLVFLGACATDMSSPTDPDASAVEAEKLWGERADLTTLLGPLDLPLAGGTSVPQRFTVPPDTLSIGITITGHPDESYWVCEWTDPNGVELVAADWSERDGDTGRCLTCPNMVQEDSHVATALLPTVPGLVPEAGEHTIRICGEAEFINPSDATVHLSVIARTGPEPTAGLLDLNLFFTGAGGWTAANASTDPAFSEILDGVRAIYEPIGLSLGEITWNDVDPSFRTVSDEEGLAALIDPVNDDTPFAINVFFVDELTNIFGAIGGTVQSIPGPFDATTPSSGVVVSIGFSEVSVPNIMAHEIGHYLGLWHTAEIIERFGEDPFSDTPLDDRLFLMHTSPAGREISEEQRRILLRSPYVRVP